MSDNHLKSIAESLAGIHSELTAIRVALNTKPPKQASPSQRAKIEAAKQDIASAVRHAPGEWLRMRDLRSRAKLTSYSDRVIITAMGELYGRDPIKVDGHVSFSGLEMTVTNMNHLDFDFGPDPDQYGT